MADVNKSKDQETQAVDPPKPEEKAPETRAAPETKYSLELLRTNCRALFDVSTATFDAATYGLSGSFTKEDMKSRINAWKSKAVESKKHKKEGKR